MDGGDDIEDWEGSVLATRYALGQMSAEEVAAFEARFAQDAEFRAQYEAWVVRVSRDAAADPEVAEQGPERAPRPAVFSNLVETVQEVLSHQIGRLVAAAVAGVLGVLLLLWLFLGGDPDPGPEPVLVAQLAPRDSAFEFTASVTPDPDAILVTRTAGSGEEGRVRQLWLIPQTADPVSLGLLDPAGRTRFLLTPALVELLAGGFLAASDEPLGGSPGVTPSGPVVAIGAFQQP